MNPAPDDVFLEIGPGDGALSLRLAPQISQLIAIEIDPDCISLLENTLAPLKSVVLIKGDFLQLDLDELFTTYLRQGKKLRIAGNLPYNIATAIMHKILHAKLPVEDMSFMVQLEVAQRIAAPPGSRQYGFLSVECQHYSDVRLGFKVSSACFVPRPKVSSAMIALRPKPTFMNPECENDFEALVKAAFSHRRKKLVNSLSMHPVFGTITQPLLAHAGIDTSRRAEDLSIQEYESLARIYQEQFKETAISYQLSVKADS